jgi:hypothetical protein
MGEAFVEWTTVDHPQYGRVEVGGTKKNFGRVEPGFLLQSDAHRNMMFTLFQTSQMPLVAVDSVTTRALGGGVTEVTAVVLNTKLAPTHTQQDLENRISRPDRVTLTGGRVIAGSSWTIHSTATPPSRSATRPPCSCGTSRATGSCA